MRPVFQCVEAMLASLTPSYPVYCLWPDRFAALASHFVDQFPGRVLYAVKCNPHPGVLEMLYAAGIRHFDTASLPEIAQVRELFSDATVYFMHPVKSPAVINNAFSVYGVDHFVLDHPRELEKIIDETGGDGITIMVRVATPSESSTYDLSSKFGASVDEAVVLLESARRAGCKVGLAFHVGSQCTDPLAFDAALTIVGEVLKNTDGIELSYLDIGGGFPGYYEQVDAPPLDVYFNHIRNGLSQLDLRKDCVVMCEPGRALVADACSLVVQIQLRKGSQIFINDGIYGSLSELVTGQIRLPVRAIRLGDQLSDTYTDFTVYGPTCDSTDVLPCKFSLPDDVREGDWIEISKLGAYSNALATRFNGFYPETFVDISRPTALD